MGCKNSSLSAATYSNTPEFTLSNKKCHVKILNVCNGDTIWVAINLYNKILKFKVHMVGYYSPELSPRQNKPNRDSEIIAAQAAKQYLESLVLGKIVNAHFFDYYKDGLLLCNLYIADPIKSNIPSPNKVCVNTLMVRNNHGYTYMGAKKH